MKKWLERLGTSGILISALCCTSPEVSTKATGGAAITSQCKLEGEHVRTTIQVPNTADVEIWKVQFQNETPDGLTISKSSSHTIVSWLVPKARVIRQPKSSYLIHFSSETFRFDVEVAIRPSGSALIDAFDIICLVRLLG